MRLYKMALRREQDVVTCRHIARMVASGLRFPAQDQVRIATAVSEIARTAVRFGQGVSVEFELESRAPHGLVCTVRDPGPGIPHLDRMLSGHHELTPDQGRGIDGARRLMDEAEFISRADGTVIRLTKHLPAGVRFSPAQAQALVNTLAQDAVPIDPLAEVAAQNLELIRVLDEVRQQNEEVAKVNEELNETNRGVVALYDELDTVYRVGRVVATKLDLPALLQAITDATTEVSGAEFGAFYLRDAPDSDNTLRQSMSGPLKELLEPHESADIARLLGSHVASASIWRVDDLSDPLEPFAPFGQDVAIRSYLAVPVSETDGAVSGCLVFGHRSPRVFTERSERILSSVAVQASIGLENARLYHSVQSSSAAKDQFLAVLSHELRTPLNPVFAVLASLEQHPDLSDDVRSDLLVMRRNLQLEARLIDDLLDLTRIVKGKVPLQLEVIDVHSLIRLAYETCAVAVVQQAINVELKLEAAQFHVRGDAARLQQVFWNLLSNAVKFTPADGLITVRTVDRGAGKLCISVTDSGKGIKTDALVRIFRPFEQGDNTIPVQYGGLGLGLAISKSIVDAHGGAIYAESAGPGCGATFVVTLPLTTAPPEMADAPGQVMRLPILSGARILLVDDHQDTRTSLQRLLTRRGHEVTLAANCQEALATASGQRFDLVISDLGLPDGSGHDLMRSLHSAHGLRGIALSGYGMEADIQRSHEAGFAAHLTKPLDFAVLEATIEKTLRRA